MTFNLRCDCVSDFNNRWHDRRKLIYYIMNQYSCDIIGTQEVTYNMFRDIKDNIKGYNIIGSQRGKKISSERNNILVSKDHNIHEHRTFWLSENTDEIASKKWYSYLPRICNTHLDNLLPKARKYQLKKLMKVIEKEQEKEKLPLILMGDFNAVPKSNLIKDFTKGKLSKQKLIAVQDKNKSLYNQGTISNFKRTQKGFHIDYIFVSEEIEVLNVEIIKYNSNGKYPSDHYPLMADIKIKH